MGLAERLAHAPKGRGHSCSIGILMASWPTEGRTGDLAAIKAAMADPDWSGVAITGILAEEGYLVKLDHVQQHRRGACTSGTCPMPAEARLR